MRNGIIKVLEYNVDAFKGNDLTCVGLRKQLGEREAFHQHAPEFSVGGEPATETRINVVVERDESSLKSYSAAVAHQDLEDKCADAREGADVYAGVGR